MSEKIIGWVGVGAMGDPMARRLMAAGYRITVLDRSSANTQLLIRDGADPVDTVEKMAQKAAVIFAMIPKDEVLQEIALSLKNCEETIKTKILIDMSTLSPEGSRIAARDLEAAGIDLLRAPVTGSTPHAAAGTLGIMVSGPKKKFEECLPLLQILGDRQTWLGETEEARYYKLAINMMLGNVMQALAESLVFGEKNGLDFTTLIDLLADSAAGAPIVRYKAANLKKRDYSPMSVAYNTDKDLGMAMEIAQKSGTVLPVTAFTRQMFVSMRAKGMDMLDMCALLMLNEELSGIRTDELQHERSY